MRPTPLVQAYHIERALAARQGIPRYTCGCERCHRFRTQSVQTVEKHHQKYGRDSRLNEPLLRNPHEQDHGSDDEIELEVHAPLADDNNFVQEDVFLDAEDYAAF